MMADVISGATPRPEPFKPSGPRTTWQKRRCWWHWAARSLAGQRALAYIGCTVPPKTPWQGGAGDWRLQPWIDVGEAATETHNQFDDAVDDVRDFLGEPLAGVMFAEICKLDFQTRKYIRSEQTFIAINVDGTRAAICRCYLSLTK